jgi:hypothetical protein
MVETIVPVVHGTRTWMLSLALFTAGAVATAGLLGLALGAALPAGGAPWPQPSPSSPCSRRPPS